MISNPGLGPKTTIGLKDVGSTRLLILFSRLCFGYEAEVVSSRDKKRTMMMRKLKNHQIQTRNSKISLPE